MSEKFIRMLALLLALAVCFSAGGSALASAPCVPLSDVAAESDAPEDPILLTVGSRAVRRSEIRYFYEENVQDFCNSYGYLAFLFGLDLNLPLDEQFYNEASGMTWADYFTSVSVAAAVSTYLITEGAAAEGFTLSAENQAELDAFRITLEETSADSGDQDPIRSAFGSGTSQEGYLQHIHDRLLADEYNTAYSDSLTFTPEQIREADAAAPFLYSNYSLNLFYLSAEDAGDGVPETLTDGSIRTAEALDEAIGALYAGEASSAMDSAAYDELPEEVAGWVTDEARQSGDLTAIAVPDWTGTTAGWYVVLFREVDDHAVSPVNVRHILVDGDDAAARAEAILEQWRGGEATEESFADLANACSTDPGSNTVGGLYEDISPGQMVEPFNDWCFDESRRPGDVGIVETSYGFHVMYFSSFGEMTLRDQSILEALRDAAMESWYDSLLAAFPITPADFSVITYADIRAD